MREEFSGFFDPQEAPISDGCWTASKTVIRSGANDTRNFRPPSLSWTPTGNQVLVSGTGKLIAAAWRGRVVGLRPCKTETHHTAEWRPRKGAPALFARDDAVPRRVAAGGLRGDWARPVF